VGIGQFYARSSEFIDPGFARRIPRENAHNNFLQVLAETGAVGLTAFLAILVAAAALAARSIRRRPSPLLIWSAGGILVFLLTCLGGHPLLVFEFSCVFWLVLGVSCSLATSTREAAECRRGGEPAWRRAAPVVIAAATVVSIPYRAQQELRTADLSGAGMALSAPRTDAEGVRFRWMLRQARVYVPTSARVVALALKLPSGMADVRISIGRRLVAQLVIDGARWHEARFTLPRLADRRFVGIDVRLGALHQRPDEEGGGTLGASGVQVGRPRVLE
jgi:hypothetical protein